MGEDIKRWRGQRPGPDLWVSLFLCPCLRFWAMFLISDWLGFFRFVCLLDHRF
jgi:hypothetical protein